MTVGLDFGTREVAVEAAARPREADKQLRVLPGDLTRKSSVAPSMTDRPDMKIETDRDRDLFQKSDRDRSTLEKVRS